MVGPNDALVCLHADRRAFFDPDNFASFIDLCTCRARGAGEAKCIVQRMQMRGPPVHCAAFVTGRRADCLTSGFVEGLFLIVAMSVLQELRVILHLAGFACVETGGHDARFQIAVDIMLSDQVADQRFGIFRQCPEFVGFGIADEL